MHNAMRHALGLPATNRVLKKLDPQLRKYLDGVLATLPKIDEENGDD